MYKYTNSKFFKDKFRCYKFICLFGEVKLLSLIEGFEACKEPAFLHIVLKNTNGDNDLNDDNDSTLAKLKLVNGN